VDEEDQLAVAAAIGKFSFVHFYYSRNVCGPIGYFILLVNLEMEVRLPGPGYHTLCNKTIYL